MSHLKKLVSYAAISFLLAGYAAAGSDARIDDIRKEYRTIRSAMSTYKHETVELDGYSTDGGTAKAFRDATGSIRLIRVELFGESGKIFEEYYYRNGLRDAAKDVLELSNEMLAKFKRRT